MRPLSIDEPTDDAVVDMLLALPESERHFYADESQVVDVAGKSEVFLRELEERAQKAVAKALHPDWPDTEDEEDEEEEKDNSPSPSFVD